MDRRAAGHGPSGGRRTPDRVEQATADYEHLIALQDELTRATEEVPDRPHLILDAPDPEIEDWEDTTTDSTEPDFDAFVATSKDVETWLTLSETAKLGHTCGAPRPHSPRVGQLRGLLRPPIKWLQGLNRQGLPLSV